MFPSKNQSGMKWDGWNSSQCVGVCERVCVRMCVCYNSLSLSYSFILTLSVTDTDVKHKNNGHIRCFSHACQKFYTCYRVFRNKQIWKSNEFDFFFQLLSSNAFFLFRYWPIAQTWLELKVWMQMKETNDRCRGCSCHLFNLAALAKLCRVRRFAQTLNEMMSIKMCHLQKCNSDF